MGVGTEEERTIREMFPAMVVGGGTARAGEKGKMEEDGGDPSEPGTCGGHGELVGRGCGLAPRYW